MKYLFASIILFFSLGVSAQRITLNQIIKMQNQNPNDFEDYMFNLKFKRFYEVEHIENYNVFSYAFNLEDLNNYLGVAKYTFEGTNVKIHISTTLFEEYRIYKKNIENVGFKYKKTSKNGDSTTHFYDKDNFTIALITYNSVDGTLYSLIYTNNLNLQYYYKRNGLL